MNDVLLVLVKETPNPRGSWTHTLTRHYQVSEIITAISSGLIWIKNTQILKYLKLFIVLLEQITVALNEFAYTMRSSKYLKELKFVLLQTKDEWVERGGAF